MIYELDPLHDPRWPALLSRHPDASVFHTPGWLQALYRTYGYRPVVLTTSPPDSELANGLVFCHVTSWLTGRRLVSLPFSDHCEPLVSRAEDLTPLLAGIAAKAAEEGCRYIEVRPASAPIATRSEWRASHDFYLHRLDLRPGAGAVFSGLHRDCIRRKIRRARTEGIAITEGTDGRSLSAFYDLVLQTRRRHGLPPQSLTWFDNLLACLGESARMRIAWKGTQPIAGILTLQYGKSIYYKYGASVARFHKLGSIPYLFWNTIQDGIAHGFEVLDMGRSDCDNAGLVTFKERWRAVRTTMTYFRTATDVRQRIYTSSWGRRLAGLACRHMPEKCFLAFGAFCYSHIE